MAADPTCIVEKSMFFANQFPYLEVRPHDVGFASIFASEKGLPSLSQNLVWNGWVVAQRDNRHA
jgi:hypothetical protein